MMRAKARALRMARMADGGDVSSPNFQQAVSDLQLSPEEQALYQRHLTNLTGPGGVDNDGSNPNLPQGSRSTLYQSPQEHDGKFYNIPTVWDGKVETKPYTRPDGTVMEVPNQTALANVAKAGWSTFPAYATPEDADARYGKMHDYMEKDTEQYPQGRTKKANGGSAGNSMRAPTNQPAFAGYIPGSTGGRTDNKPINVQEGSYVVPADILSGLGEGNSHAGWAALQAQFGMGQPPMKADGGAVGSPVPIVAASGEGVIPPEVVANIGGGDLDRGHSILDALVKHVRKKTIKSLKRLPAPKRN